jgi:thioredoxin reductase (NADPH)
MDEYDIIIVGGGIVAFGSAIYAARLNFRTLVLGENMGGTIMLADKVENYPGFKSIPGIELYEKIRDHAKDYGITVIEQKVGSIEQKDGLFSVKTLDNTYVGKTVLLATGSEWRKLNVPGEKEFLGNGVHYCALCDGYIYKEQVVGVVGGSDSAVKEALLLAEHSLKVYVINKNPELTAEPINKTKCQGHPKIEFINSNMVQEIKGEKVMQKVVLQNPYNGSNELVLDGLFIDIGRIPTSDLVKNLGVKLDEKNQIVVDAYGRTNVMGVFAAGDVTNYRFKQAVTGVAQGIGAVYCAYQCVHLKSDK